MSDNSYNEKFKQRLSILNDEQRKAVETIEGPVLVIAGPGSGKTELLSLRVANILKNTDALPQSILCLTFTDSAAANMRKRLTGLIGPEAYKVAIHTFHSFGTEIINQNPEYFYEGALYNPADELTQYQILEEIFENLDHKSQLSSYHPDQGFTYLKDSLKRISDLKKAGLSPEEFSQLIKNNKKFLTHANKLISEFFSDRISKKKIDEAPTLIEKMSEKIDSDNISIPNNNFKSAAEEIIGSLKKSHSEALEENSTKPITAWKAKYTKKNKQKQTVLKDFENIQKHEDLAKIYAAYQSAMHQKGFFDFDDMLLDTVQSLENHPDLKYNVQEKYLYVMVDEFQDTSGVQMRLLDNVLDTEINNGRPNILAVGDDDQAIFKFQGANIANIMNFHSKYKSPEIIVLEKNYRSTQPVLDIVRKVVLKGAERLEKLLPEISKELTAANPNLSEGNIVAKEFNSAFQEYCWIVKVIKKKLEEGLPPNEIAIISPKHKMLEQAAKVLDYYGIPVCYERKKDIFKQRHISQIMRILQFVNSLNIRGEKEADELLPEVLAFDFWQVPRFKIWQISTKSYKEKKNWLEIMLEDDNSNIRIIANFLIQLGSIAKEHTVEEVIDFISGVNDLKIEDISEVSLIENEKKDPAENSDQNSISYTSPYKSYYFNQEKFNENRAEYLDFLSCLSSFLDAVRNYKGSESLTVSDLLEFEKLHKTHDIRLTYTNEFNNDENAVNLLTAHKAKGMEFDTVFVINCQDEIWIKGGYRDKLSFPSNLPLSAETENDDDKMRLFYVALSRAKRHLYITSHKLSEKNKEQIRLRFLEGVVESETENDENSFDENQENIQKLFELKHLINKTELPNADEKELLKNLVKNYKLSATHLNNFLNIIDGGPTKFLEQNLLRFPQKQNLSASYGSAMHNALHIFQNQFRRTNSLPDLDFLIEQFTKSLNKQRLNKKDYKSQLTKGSDYLSIYYEKRKNNFDPNDKPEVRFDSQGVIIGNAEITGNIDKVKFDNENREIQVYDYKTGGALYDWGGGKQSYDSLKAWKYKNQLIFYKILVENARDYRSKYKVNTGSLEFIEADNNGEIQILNLPITDFETGKMKKIIQAVYSKIINLDFPDVSEYEPSLHGIENFICDLIN